MLLITSGFGETGEEGKKLEAELVEKARKAGILILGPNTMGIRNPHINFYCTGFPAKPRAGSTTMVSQSGNMGVQLLAFAEQQGIGIRGFCGSGNEAMMCIEDYLDGLEAQLGTSDIPFERLDKARNQDKGGGVGLGLSIALDIARSHGGALVLDTSTRLGGLRAVLSIPR